MKAATEKPTQRIRKDLLFPDRPSFIAVMLLLLLFAFAACNKDDDATTPNPAISAVPAIQLLSVSPDTIHQLSDSLVFSIQYTDGDGDLGDYDADTLSLWITDNRFPLTNKFHIPPLAPQGATIAITGTLNVVLEHIILKDANAASESATFKVQLKDRAGHWSNEVSSDAITILP